jgi:hypothetical protein
VGCSTKPRSSFSASFCPLCFPCKLAQKESRRADSNRLPLLQLRVIGHVLQRFARACKSRISKRLSFLCLALRCTVLRSRWYQSGINFIPIFAGHHRPPAASQTQSVEEGGPSLLAIRRFDEAPFPSVVTACARSLPPPRRPPRVLRLPRPSRCPLLPKSSFAFRPAGGGSRVFTVSWDYVQASLGTARPITPAVD